MHECASPLSVLLRMSRNTFSKYNGIGLSKKCSRSWQIYRIWAFHSGAISSIIFSTAQRCLRPTASCSRFGSLLSDCTGLFLLVMSFQSTTPEGNNILSLTRIRNRLVHLCADRFYRGSRISQVANIISERILKTLRISRWFSALDVGYRHTAASPFQVAATLS